MVVVEPPNCLGWVLWEGAGVGGGQEQGVRVLPPPTPPICVSPQNTFRHDPLRLVAVMRAILEGEKAAVLKRVGGPCPPPRHPEVQDRPQPPLTPLCSAPGPPPAPQLPPAAGGAEVQPGAGAAAAPSL